MTERSRPKRSFPQRMLRALRLRPRLLAAIAVGVIVIAVLPQTMRLATRLLVGWDISAVVYLALAFHLFSRTNVAAIKHRAAEQDDGRFVVLIVTALAAFASLAAIFFELSAAHRGPAALLLATATVILSWSTIHTTFALHYAHDYYRGSEANGLVFPNDDAPDYWDFVYFSFVIGMTAQVSDVGITSKAIRRTATAHGVASFIFNTALLALMVNIAAGLL